MATKKEDTIYRCNPIRSIRRICESAFEKNSSKQQVSDNTENVSEAEIDTGEAIPFRLEKYDVLPQFFHVNVKVKSALKDEKSPMPDWGDALPYPFSHIVGASLWDGLAAASGFERGFSRDTYEKNSVSLDSAVAKQREKFSDIITTEDVIFHPKIAITDRREGNSYGNPLSDVAQNYANVAKNLVSKQVYDIGEDGNLVINPDYHGSILQAPNRKKNREVCKLVRMTANDVAWQCGITGTIGCIRFIENVRNIVQNNRVSVENIGVPKNGRNPNYGKFTDYFAKYDCVMDDGRIDVQKFIELLKAGSVQPDEFLEEFVIGRMMCSDPSKTYVWVPLNNPRAGDCEKDLAIYTAYNNGEISESIDGEVDEAISGLTDKETGNVLGDYWNEQFFLSMLAAKQQSSRRVVTFLTKGRQKEIVLSQEVVNQRTIGFTREFIVIDNVESDIKELDFTPFFSDERYSGVLNGTAPKKFTCRKISGVCFGFPYNPDIEKWRMEEVAKRQKKDNPKFLEQYLAAYGMNDRNLGGYHITLLCPEGSGNDKKSYFFFRGYNPPSNPTVDGVDVPSESYMSKILPSDSNTLLSTIWYNEATTSTSGKINLPTNARASQTSGSGRSIGYKSAKLPG